MTSGLREGEKFPYTSGNTQLKKLFTDFNQIFSGKATSFPKPEIVSNCCGSRIEDETDICSKCGEHCDKEETE